MRTLWRPDLHDERGSIMLAMLGIIILTTVATVGLAAVVNGQNQTRHDNTFSQALNNAEGGVDAMVATIKNGVWNDPNGSYKLSSPTDAPSVVPKFSASTSQGTYTVQATAQNDIGNDGTAKYTTWTVQATGTAVVAGRTLTRNVSETVRIRHRYNTPVEGANGMNVNDGSAVGNYQYVSPTHDNGDGTTGPPADTVDTTQVVGASVTLPVLGTVTLATINVNNIPTNTSPGAAQTGGPLTMEDGAVNGGIDSIAMDQGSSCTSSAAVCDSSTLIDQTDVPAPAINPIGCSSTSLSGADVTTPLGTVPLTVLPLSGPYGNGLILNDNINLDLTAVPPITNDVCTNLPVVLPTVGVNLASASLPAGLGSITSSLTDVDATLQVPIGASCGGVSGLTTLLTGTLDCNMNPPDDLVINQLGSAPVVLGTSTGTPTLISATITNAGGDCYIGGNVILIGSIACNTITMAPGASLVVYYPYTIDGAPNTAGASETKNQGGVANWNECVSADQFDCKVS